MLLCVDDLTIAEALLLKEELENDTENTLVKPLNFHDRKELVLPPETSKVQKQLDDLDAYATENQMKINKRKTKTMLFNTANKRDFTPRMKIGKDIIDLVEEMKLLGVKITSDLRWNENATYITKKAYSRIWLIRRLKQMGANTNELIDVYEKEIRSVLEFASVVWHAGLTVSNTTDIERVQKTFLAIVLGKDYTGYEAALQETGF